MTATKKKAKRLFKEPIKPMKIHQSVAMSSLSEILIDKKKKTYIQSSRISLKTDGEQSPNIKRTVLQNNLNYIKK